MTRSDGEAREVPQVVRDFARQILLAKKAVMLYPASSPIPVDLAQGAVKTLNAAQQVYGEILLIVSRSGVFFEDGQVHVRLEMLAAIAEQLYNHQIAEIRFHAGVAVDDLVRFLRVTDMPREEVAAAGGFAAVLWETGVSTITVTAAQVTLVEADIAAGAVAPQDRRSLAEDRKDIGALLSGTLGEGYVRERTLARVTGDPDAIRDYLEATHAGETGIGGSGLEATVDRFMDLVDLASDVDAHTRELLVSLMNALRTLEPSLRRMLLLDLLPKVRESATLSSVIGQIDVHEIVQMLVDGVDADRISLERLARAIQSLVMLRSIDRDKVIAAAGAAMMEAGLDERAVAEVLERGAPRRLEVGERAEPTRRASALESLMEAVGLSPSPRGDDWEEAAVAALRAEAREGITDGDVMWALVALVARDAREAPFASIMSLLEDCLGLLLTRGEIQLAADAAYVLLDAAKNPELTVGQRTRLENAVGRFARAEDVREIARVLRTHSPGTPEHDAAGRLIQSLGVLAIQPLLEQLAEEQNMAVRKFLVDLLSGMAAGHIPQLGTYVSDSRWYFVRNVVSILGATRSSEALVYLERTRRHEDARVRRETIRAVAGIEDPLAVELLIGSLSDRDTQNVQLAARYLGAAGVHEAIPGLLLVANGEGVGSRETPARVEAIEALGALRAVGAVPTLGLLAARRRGLSFGSGRSRELRAAAEAALRAIGTGR